MRRTFVGLVVAGLVMLLALPGQLAQADGPKVIRVGATQSIDSMNPFLAVRLVSSSLQRMMYGFLTVPDPKTLQPSPDLAESWTTSADGLTWTFRLRQAKWSDGQPLTAADAAWTFTTIMTDEAAKTGNGPAVENFAAVTANGQDLVIKLKSPQASMLDNPVPILPKHVWEKVGAVGKYEAESYPAVGIGPYLATEHKKDQYVKLKANPDHWRGAPKIDELQLVFYDNPAAAIVGLKKGEIDLIGRLAPADFGALAGDPNIVQWNTDGRRATYLQVNHGATTSDGKPIGDGHPALKDVKVRQAIHTAIDKQKLVDEAQNGLAAVANGSIVPPMYKDFFWQAEGDQKVAYDVAKANKLLDDAGYRKGADGIRTMPDGSRKLQFRFSIHTDTPSEEKLAEYLTGFLKDIGIGLTVKRLDSSKFTEETGVTALFDLAISGWSVNPDPEEVLATHLCSRRPSAAGEGGGTESFYCNPQYEQLYQQQLKELDRSKRAEIIKKMQERLYTDAPVIALYYPNDLEGYRKDRIAKISSIPEEKGLLYGGVSFWPFYTVETVSAEEADSGGTSSGLIAGLAAGVAVLAVGGFVLARRRRTGADDRE